MSKKLHLGVKIKDDEEVAFEGTPILVVNLEDDEIKAFWFELEGFPTTTEYYSRIVAIAIVALARSRNEAHEDVLDIVKRQLAWIDESSRAGSLQ